MDVVPGVVEHCAAHQRELHDEAEEEGGALQHDTCHDTHVSRHTRGTRDPHLAQDGRHKVVVVVFVRTVRLVEVLDQVECLLPVLASTR